MSVGTSAVGGVGWATTRIHVTLREAGLSIFPDPAIVRVGSEVTWRCDAGGRVDNTGWEIYFTHGSPSPETRLHSPAPFAEIAFVPMQTGDWKYGVRATDLKTGAILADDDPMLIVTS